MLLSFAIIMSGIAFAIRISLLVVDRFHLLTREQMTKIGTCYIGFLICSALFSARSYTSLWIMTFVPQALFIAAMSAVRLARARSFRRKFTESLALIILKMKSGRAFRQAFNEIISESEPHSRSKLAEIRDLVVFSQQKINENYPPFVRSIIIEFRIVDRNPHASLRRLQTLRDRLRSEDGFRRKSGQVLQQIRAQSLLLAGLYVAVFIFTASRFGMTENLSFIVVSLILFLIGQGWIWFGGRSFKWKV